MNRCCVLVVVEESIQAIGRLFELELGSEVLAQSLLVKLIPNEGAVPDPSLKGNLEIPACELEGSLECIED